MTVLEVYLEQFTDAIGVLSAEAGVLAFHYEAEYFNRRDAVMTFVSSAIGPAATKAVPALAAALEDFDWHVRARAAGLLPA